MTGSDSGVVLCAGAGLIGCRLQLDCRGFNKTRMGGGGGGVKVSLVEGVSLSLAKLGGGGGICGEVF